MATEKGLHILHLGLILGERLIAPPSQFALATIGVMNYQEQKQTLDELVNAMKSGAVKTEDTPMLDYYYNTEQLNMSLLRQNAKKTYGSQKIITKKAVLPINRKEQLVTLSRKHQANFRVESRRLRKKQRPYNVTIYNPFEIERILFRGGTPFADHNLAKGHHWSKGQLNEKLYLESLSRKEREQFEQSFEMVEYARACAFIELSRILSQHDESMIGGSGEIFENELKMPFNFLPRESDDINRKLSGFKQAMEIYLLRTSSKKIIKEVLELESGKLTLAEVDLMTLGKTGFVPREMDPYTNQGITRGLILDDKSFPDYSWAIIQAIEKHFFSLGREFKGYSLEFADNPEFRTASIVFDTPKYSRQNQEQKYISMRIMLSDKFRMPYTLYKNFQPTREDLSKVKIINDKPTNLVNMPADRTTYAKGWMDIDWRTGQKCLCIIREPTQDILNMMEHISKKGSYRGINASTMRGRYINNMKQIAF